MLKWTVTKRSEPPNVPMQQSVITYGQSKPRKSLGHLYVPLRTRDIRECRRKSIGSTECARRCKTRDKENQMDIIPYTYATGVRTLTSTPFTKHDFALRDVLNITPNRTPVSSAAPLTRKRNLSLSPVETPAEQRTQYASTLPTFDVEYSPPCGEIKSTPMIPLRNVTIKDSYFKNPCYFRDEESPAAKRLKISTEMTPLSGRLSELRFSKTSIKRPSDVSCNNNNNNIKIKDDQDDSIISSKALNDSELEKMIDAILQSTKKEKLNGRRKISIRKRNNNPSQDGLPTYTPADDPANDLSKFCDDFKISPKQILEAGEKTIILDSNLMLNEREVKTPNVTENNACDQHSSNKRSCHLKRQRVVRRKKGDPDKGSAVMLSDTKKYDTSSESHSFHRKSFDYSTSITTPKEMANESINNIIKKNTSKLGYESTPCLRTYDDNLTPTSGTQHTIRRCLTFSESPDSTEDSIYKRQSIASSVTSTKSSSNFIAEGSLDLNITADDKKIQIHGEWVVRSFNH